MNTERRVYIISPFEEITEEVVKTAQALNCPEIARGIPQRILDIGVVDKLPFVYTEIIPETKPKISITEKIIAVIEELETKGLITKFEVN